MLVNILQINWPIGSKVFSSDQVRFGYPFGLVYLNCLFSFAVSLQKWLAHFLLTRSNREITFLVRKTTLAQLSVSINIETFPIMLDNREEKITKKCEQKAATYGNKSSFEKNKFMNWINNSSVFRFIF